MKRVVLIIFLLFPFAFCLGQGGSLTEVLSSDKLDRAFKESLIKLEGNTIDLIKTENDLSIFTFVVDELSIRVKKIKHKEKEVLVYYDQSTKLLGIFASNINTRIIVNSDGRTEIKLPWYHFLFSKDRNQIDELERKTASVLEETFKNFKAVGITSRNEEIRVQSRASIIHSIVESLSVI